ncbi:MAG: aminodeoxychorismate lyase [Pseudomonadota bacterium]
MPDTVTASINGRAADQISIQDRGLLYGQTLFETIAVVDQQPLLLGPHLQRLQSGCDALQIGLDSDLLTKEVTEFCQQQDAEKWVLRVTLSMGVGGRGYKNPDAPEPVRILSRHSYPDHPSELWEQGITLGLVDVRLARQPLLAGIKHGNRLEQIIARSQWQSGWHEALVRDDQDHVIEGTQSNLFIRNGEQISTPDLRNCGVAGVMREQVLQIANKIGASTRIVSLSSADIIAADEVFLSNSLVGVWPVKTFMDRQYDDFNACHKLLKLLQEDGSVPTI